MQASDFRLLPLARSLLDRKRRRRRSAARTFGLEAKCAER